MTSTPRNSALVARVVAGFSAVVLLGAATVALLAAPAVGQAPATQVVSYRGLRLDVPASWTVVDLERNPRACVRLDQHAVYLGHPGQHEDCPVKAYGRTEALVIEPADQTTASDRHGATPVSAGQSPSPSAAEQAERLMRVSIGDAGVVVTESWGTDRPVVDAALRSGHVVATSGSVPGSGGAAAPAPSSAPPRALSTAPSAPAAVAPVTNVQQASGDGFDACALPSDPALMANVKQQTGWVAAGFYLGGANAACPQLGFGVSYVRSVTAQGWTLIPIWVGRQFDSCGGGCSTIDPTQAVGQGSAEADAAVAAAQSVGIGGTSPLYLDLEGYPTSGANTQTAQLFTQGWTGRLHALGYTSGFYSSAGSGIADIVSGVQAGLGNMPDDLWIAHYDCSDTTADNAVPAGLYPARRIRQYRSPSTSCSSPQASVGFGYDSNSINGATAGAGAGGFPAYVNKVFLDFLGRFADPAGGAYWVGQLRAGVSWQSFVYAVTTSAEHLRRSADGDFLRFLHRAPEQDGSDYFTFFLAQTLRNDLVETSMIGSGEYFVVEGGSDPTNWLQHVYQDVLGRPGDPGGISYWLGQYNAGTPRTAIVDALVHSDEGAGAMVNYAFSVALHRPADANGQAYYGAVLQQQLGWNVFALDALLDSSWEAWSSSQA